MQTGIQFIQSFFKAGGKTIINSSFFVFTPGGMTIKFNFTGFIIYFLIGFNRTIFISLDHHSFFFWKFPVVLPAYYEIVVSFFF